MRHRLELRDLRSLERRGLYRIFPALDAHERLPRELVIEGRRHRRLERHKHLGVAGALYLPGLILLIVVLAGLGVNPVLAFVVAGVVLAGFYVYSLAIPYR